MVACFSSSSSITTGVGPPSTVLPSRSNVVVLAVGVGVVGVLDFRAVVSAFQKFVTGELEFRWSRAGGRTSSSSSSSLTIPAGRHDIGSSWLRE